MTRETVGTETPARRAIIAMVTFRLLSGPTVRPFASGSLRSQKATAAGAPHPFTLPARPPMSWRSATA